jgi:hypothetical protein
MFAVFNVYLHCTKPSALLFALKDHNSTEIIFIVALETLQEHFTFHYLIHV